MAPPSLRVRLLAVFAIALPAALALSELACRAAFGRVFPRDLAPPDAAAYASDAAYDRVSVKRKLGEELGAPELLDYLLPQDMPLTAGIRPVPSPDDLARGEDGRPRVLIIGDSVAEGARVEAGETFAARLAERMPGRRFINIAQGGLNIYQIYAKFTLYYRKAAPAAVIYVACENDPLPGVWLARRRNPLEPSYLYATDPVSGFPALSAPARWLLERDALRSALARLLILYAPFLSPSPGDREPLDALRRFERPYALFVGAMEKACRLDGVPFLVVKVHPRDRRRKEFLDMLAAGVREKNGLRVFEMEREFFMDDFHLNARGHEDLARRLLPVLSRRRAP